MEALVTASGFLLGKEVAVQTISSTSVSILNSVKSIMENYCSETNKLFQKLDIKFKLDIIEEFISQIDTKSAVVQKCISYIKEIIILIEKEIKILEDEIVNYNKKWFGNLSFSQYKEQLLKIESHVALLDNRFNILVKII